SCMGSPDCSDQKMSERKQEQNQNNKRYHSKHIDDRRYHEVKCFIFQKAFLCRQIEQQSEQQSKNKCSSQCNQCHIERFIRSFPNLVTIQSGKTKCHPGSPPLGPKLLQ